jgi:uncharacterized protein YjiS (DUF1127 family)
MEVGSEMAKIIDRSHWVASPVDLAKASLEIGTPSGRGSRAGGAAHWRTMLRTWRGRCATRRALRSLDDHMLRDAGFEPRAARREARRPFWRPVEIERSDRC